MSRPCLYRPLAFWLWVAALVAPISSAGADGWSPIRIGQSQRPCDAIEHALASPTELQFIEVPLVDVVAYLAKRHAIEIQVDSRVLEESGVALDTQITRSLKGVSLRSALNLILRDLKLTWVVRDCALLITTEEAAGQFVETWMFPVRDLVMPRLACGCRMFSPAAAASLRSLVKDLIPASIKGQGTAGRIEVTSDAVIIVNGVRAVQEEVQTLLSMLRTACCQQRAGGCAGCGQPMDFNAPATLRRIRAALDQPVNWDFDEVPLTDVFDFIKRQFGIEVQLDNGALEESGVTQFNLEVTQHVRGVPLKQALRRMLRDMELTSVIRDEVLLVTSQSVAQAIFEFRVYCVSSLAGTSSTGRPMPTLTPDELLASIKAHIAPTMWGRHGDATADAQAFAACGALVVRQTADVHDQIADYLAARCRLAERQFSVCRDPCSSGRSTSRRWHAWRRH